MPKRGERAVPPVPPHGWTVRFLNRAAAARLADLCATAPGPTWVAWETLTFRPADPDNRQRHHLLRGDYALHVIDDVPLEQWQYEVTAGGRIWFCPEPKTRTVWITPTPAKAPEGNRVAGRCEAGVVGGVQVASAGEQLLDRGGQLG